MSNYSMEVRSPGTSSLSAGAGEPPQAKAFRGLTEASHPAGVYDVSGVLPANIEIIFSDILY